MSPNDWQELADIVVHLMVAFVLGIPVGWDRDRHEAAAGLRTYPLLSMGACAYLEIGQYAFRESIEAQARVFQGVVAGIGFIGAGAILKDRAGIHGIATAVSLWITVGIGIAVSYGLFALGAVLSVTTLLALRWLTPFKLYPERADK